jgi:hypothetical protein
MDQVTRVPFRTYAMAALPDAAATTVTEYDLALANLGARAVAVGSAFEYFRFAKLSAYQYSTMVGPVYDVTNNGIAGNRDGEHALAFIESNAALSGTATTIAQCAQYEKFHAGSLFSQLRLNVPRDVLGANAYKWFNTASTGASTDDLSPGLFISAGRTSHAVLSGSAGALSTVIEGVLEFRGMITPALSFAAVSDDEDFTAIAQRSDTSSVHGAEAARPSGKAESARNPVVAKRTRAA